MKSFVQIISLCFIFFSALANAHSGGHDQPQTIYEEEAITTATYHIKRLINQGQLTNDWETAKASSAILERRDSRMNWIVSFIKPEQKNDKQTLYIFLTNTGYYLSANFTGK